MHVSCLELLTLPKDVFVLLPQIIQCYTSYSWSIQKQSFLGIWANVDIGDWNICFPFVSISNAYFCACILFHQLLSFLQLFPTPYLLSSPIKVSKGFVLIYNSRKPAWVPTGAARGAKNASCKCWRRRAAIFPSESYRFSSVLLRLTDSRGIRRAGRRHYISQFPAPSASANLISSPILLGRFHFNCRTVWLVKYSHNCINSTWERRQLGQQVRSAAGKCTLIESFCK